MFPVTMQFSVEAGSKSEMQLKINVVFKKTTLTTTTVVIQCCKIKFCACKILTLALGDCQLLNPPLFPGRGYFRTFFVKEVSGVWV